MKSRRVLVLPGCLRERDASPGMKRAPKEHDQAVETEEHGRRAVNGQIRYTTPVLWNHDTKPIAHQCVEI